MRIGLVSIAFRLTDGFGHDLIMNTLSNQFQSQLPFGLLTDLDVAQEVYDLLKFARLNCLSAY